MLLEHSADNPDCAITGEFMLKWAARKVNLSNTSFYIEAISSHVQPLYETKNIETKHAFYLSFVIFQFLGQKF
jgi:hypothetical protein